MDMLKTYHVPMPATPLLTTWLCTTPSMVPPMRRPQAGHDAPYGALFGATPRSTAVYGATSYTAPPTSAQTWDTFALAQHFTDMSL
jgi:hypothetical protein